MNRLNNIGEHMIEPMRWMKLDSLVKEEDRDILRKVERFCEDNLHSQKFLDFYQKAQFPYYLLDGLRELDIGRYFVPPPFGKESSLLLQGLIVATIASHDLGVSTFLFLQLPLSARTISLLGSQEQKQKYLPDLISLKKICGWALTERSVGSNSTRLGTTYTCKGDCYELNGDKRWIGNGVNDLIIIYGNMAQEKRVVGAIVQNNTSGVTSKAIPNKYGFRIIQNAQIQLEKVKVDKNQFLPGANNYKNGVEDVIKHSRLIVIWNAVGGCMGVYNMASKYCKSLREAGKVVSFQNMQKLGQIMSQVQAVILIAWRLTQLSQKGSLQTPTVGMFKGWITSRGRYICTLGRQIIDQLSTELQIMKMLLDMEIIYTYQGSYDMNILLAGSQLTGVKAFT